MSKSEITPKANMKDHQLAEFKEALDGASTMIILTDMGFVVVACCSLHAVSIMAEAYDHEEIARLIHAGLEVNVVISEVLGELTVTKPEKRATVMERARILIRKISKTFAGGSDCVECSY